MKIVYLVLAVISFIVWVLGVTWRYYGNPTFGWHIITLTLVIFFLYKSFKKEQ